LTALADRYWWVVALAILAMTIYLLMMCWLVNRPNTGSVETLLFKWRAVGWRPEESDNQKPTSAPRRWFRRKPPDSSQVS
jgi:hypothetical protein